MGSYLYARPSFWTGLARSLDLFGTFDEYNSHLLPEDADYAALLQDSYAVGDDLEAALAEFNKLVERERLATQPALLEAGA